MIDNPKTKNGIEINQMISRSIKEKGKINSSAWLRILSIIIIFPIVNIISRFFITPIVYLINL